MADASKTRRTGCGREGAATRGRRADARPAQAPSLSSALPRPTINIARLGDKREV